MSKDFDEGYKVGLSGQNLTRPGIPDGLLQAALYGLSGGLLANEPESEEWWDGYEAGRKALEEGED